MFKPNLTLKIFAAFTMPFMLSACALSVTPSDIIEQSAANSLYNQLKERPEVSCPDIPEAIDKLKLQCEAKLANGEIKPVTVKINMPDSAQFLTVETYLE